MSSGQEEVFKVATLVSHLNKQNIQIKAVFAYENRVVFLFISYIQFGLECFIYVPSKYNIQAEKSIGMPLYELAFDESDSSSSSKSEDSLFVNPTVTTTVRKDRKEKSNSMSRFIPLLAEQPYKMLYIDKYYMVYIDRHNEVASFIVSSPTIANGYYFTTDMEYFLKAGSATKIYSDIKQCEKALCNTVYSKINTSMIDNRATLVRLQQKLRELNPIAKNDLYAKRVGKLDDLCSNGKHDSAIKLANTLRNENFDTMFDMEKWIYILNSLK